MIQSGGRHVSRFVHDRSVIHAKQHRPENIVRYCFASTFAFELFFYLHEIAARSLYPSEVARCMNVLDEFFIAATSPAARFRILMSSVL